MLNQMVEITSAAEGVEFQGAFHRAVERTAKSTRCVPHATVGVDFLRSRSLLIDGRPTLKTSVNMTPRREYYADRKQHHGSV